MKDPPFPMYNTKDSVEDILYLRICASVKLDNFEDYGIPAEVCIAESLNGLLPVQWLVAT
jgi:hypothetical protein